METWLGVGELIEEVVQEGLILHIIWPKDVLHKSQQGRHAHIVVVDVFIKHLPNVNFFRQPGPVIIIKTD